jgi:hypothetical protein
LIPFEVTFTLYGDVPTRTYARRSAYDLMKFHPKRKFIVFLGIFSIIVSAGLAFLSFHSLGFKTTIPALIFFGIFVFLIIPVIKNQ